MYFKKSRWGILLLPFIFSCNSSPEIENIVYDFQHRAITADLTEAVSKGIEIPTSRQIPSGYFKLSFQFRGDKNKKYFYKIYYRNESYKFPEGTDFYNPMASENFYG